ncbi:alpha/beta fold hydrolase [Crossiella cryophila]|uniref:Pimeloyl-ACP methyl ester carboxylesterase n=1 Tax=Crossiella cryophila TaxID=43355 RepID=A0A7W7CHS7_9PSEU|nr:alpha/beta fold hydrolase [Crossiella cryophila]MBB4679714.1 pimeloyl-ACP methyl ester carboxylesterase [Crossiella cryophila]
MGARKTTAVLGAVLLTLTTSAPAVAAPTDELSGYRSQQLTWSACADPDLAAAGVDCAKVEVPLDYRDPGGRRIEVAISRKKAAEPARRRGVLLTNPGGPGGEGLFLAAKLAEQPIARVYDLIGMDPRGVGQSTRLSCFYPPTPELTTRPPEAELPLWTQLARDTETGCGAAGGAFRQHVTSMNTARDLDLIRAALREEKINYVGYSYGTFLGAMYGTMFPDRLDRSVLDSALDPRKTWHQQDYDTLGAFKDNLRNWTEWTAARNGTFKLGDKPAAVRAAVDRIAAEVQKRPLGLLTNVSAFDRTIGNTTRYRRMWADLALAVRELLTQAEGGAGRAAGGDLAAAGAILHAARQQVTEGTYNSVVCDWYWPQAVNGYLADMRQVRDTFPYADAVNFMAPKNCTFYLPRDRMTRIRPRAYPTGLVVQSEGDTQTAHANGVAMARHQKARLINVRDDGNHAHYGIQNNTCVDRLVNAYLLDGALPAPRVDCPGVDKPKDIPADSARAKSTVDNPATADLVTAAREIVARDLVRGQR